MWGDSLFGMGRNESYDVKYKYITSACVGNVIHISQLEDSIYSTGILGDGYAVITKEKNVYSPVNGVVERISNNGHSFNIVCDDGLKVLIHIGKDSNCDERLPTTVIVKEKQAVVQGEHICNIDCAEAGRDHDECTVEVVISNSDSFDEFEVTPQNALDIKACIIKYR